MKIKYILFLLSLSLSMGCTKDFEEINQNPNNPTQVEPDFLLTTSIFQAMNLYGGDMNRVVFFNYTQHFSGFQGEFQRYSFNNATNSGYWKSTYIGCMQPVNQIILNFKANSAYKNRVLIAQIWKDYIISNAVSIWGAVPTTEALNGSPSVPFTKEEDIYYNLLADLKQLASSIDLSGDKYSVVADKIYGGDLLKWKKFANTLRLRLAMRISNAAPNGNPEAAKKLVQEIFANEQNTITVQAETAAPVWGTSSDTWSPLYNYVVYNYTANKATIPVVNESLIYHMAPYNDARLAIYAQPAKQGPQLNKFFGQNISYGGGSQYASGQVNPHTGLKQDDYSYIGARFLKPDAEYVFISYTEACFLKAEASLKGWGGSKSAEQYYYEGIDASYNRYGLTSAQAAIYKNTPGVKWSSASDTTGRSSQFKDWLQICSSYIAAGDNYKQIIMQHGYTRTRRRCLGAYQKEQSFRISTTICYIRW
ncbi:SusD/RagB family nutrient-binding outer membrane lipoprotein [Pedobacter fastidiosus]|uniref:SusD/RagB family nutrient-binding outer membrane lipoprotein n=1 Tax=Pedobacter fastidiosus TaxID=2765361 RepID=UPI0021D04E05|nr:SusD/RagB family nutrient-binding outer membrane lipoprotein [Pedobacter fastidiosus]